MDLTCLLFGSAFVIAGYLFSTGLLLNHIKAWQSMPAEEKRNIKAGPLCRNIGFFIGLAGVIFLVSGLFAYVRIHLFVWLMIGWLVLSGLNLWVIDKKHLYYIQ